MTEKDLARLKRMDLLALLVEQGRQAGELETSLGETQAALNEANGLAERLKERLNEKDAQLERLKERLDEKDAQIERLKQRLDQKDIQLGQLSDKIEDFTSGRYLEMEGLHSLTDISGRLDLMLRLAQNAVENYIGAIAIQKPSQDEDGETKEGTIEAP